MRESLSGKHVLLAEDNDLNAEIAVTILEEAGLVIERVEDGIQCANRIEQMSPGTYDLILMDIVMPGVNGFQATRQIARGVTTKHIPIVIVSTKDQDTDRVWGKRQGACDYLTKPIDESQLISVIKRYLTVG